jgi:hypothetical protein
LSPPMVSGFHELLRTHRPGRAWSAVRHA